LSYRYSGSVDHMLLKCSLYKENMILVMNLMTLVVHVLQRQALAEDVDDDADFREEITARLAALRCLT